MTRLSPNWSRRRLLNDPKDEAWEVDVAAWKFLSASNRVEQLLDAVVYFKIVPSQKWHAGPVKTAQSLAPSSLPSSSVRNSHRIVEKASRRTSLWYAFRPSIFTSTLANSHAARNSNGRGTARSFFVNQTLHKLPHAQTALPNSSRS